MKLIVCLSVLSLILAPLAIGLTMLKGETSFGCSIVAEQSQHAFPLPQLWWHRDARWERIVGSLLRKRKKKRRRRCSHRWRRWLTSLRRGLSRLWVRLWRRWWRFVRGVFPLLFSRRTRKAKSTPGAGLHEREIFLVMPTETHEPEETSRPTKNSTVGESLAPRPTKRGRHRVIPTDHVSCPNEMCPAYGRLGGEPGHDIVANGTYTTRHGEKRQLYRCNVCGKTFSETAGTPFFGLKTPMHTVCTALLELAEGLGIRAVARIHGVKPDTVLLWLRRAGEHCEQVSDYMMREMEVTQVQMDELWTFVRRKTAPVQAWEEVQQEWGKTWIWVAFDPVHKLVLALLVGKRDEEAAVTFLRRLRDRLAETALPLLTSDSLPHYASAILRVFGVWIQPQRRGNRGRFPKPRQVPPKGLQYAVVHKKRQKGHVVSVTTRIVYGQKEEIMARLASMGQKINTSFVERFNLTLRHLVSRLHRKTLCFSKKREYLVYHIHLSLGYYHFVRYHSSLQVALPEPVPTRGNGTPKRWAQRTPAMAAGLTDHRWTLKELLMYHVPATPG